MAEMCISQADLQPLDTAALVVSFFSVCAICRSVCIAQSMHMIALNAVILRRCGGYGMSAPVNLPSDAGHGSRSPCKTSLTRELIAWGVMQVRDAFTGQTSTHQQQDVCKQNIPATSIILLKITEGLPQQGATAPLMQAFSFQARER